jgi:hypothetical protein
MEVVWAGLKWLRIYLMTDCVDHVGSVTEGLPSFCVNMY